MIATLTKANSPPARPQKTAPTTKATSFQLAVRTPRVDAAISLVASERSERPKRYLRARSVNRRITMTTIHTT